MLITFVLGPNKAQKFKTENDFKMVLKIQTSSKSLFKVRPQFL